MTLTPTDIDGMFIVALTPRGDERGSFTRVFCRQTFAEQGVAFDIAQMNLAHTRAAGTLRGFHYQTAPSDEAKYVQCIRGRLYDAVIDLRPDSPSYLRCVGVTLAAEEPRAVIVPARCGHAYLTLTDDTAALYAARDVYAPQLERGVRFDDPVVRLDWPMTPTQVSDKDRAWPDYVPVREPRP